MPGGIGLASVIFSRLCLCLIFSYSFPSSLPSVSPKKTAMGRWESKCFSLWLPFIPFMEVTQTPFQIPQTSFQVRYTAGTLQGIIICLWSSNVEINIRIWVLRWEIEAQNWQSIYRMSLVRSASPFIPVMDLLRHLTEPILLSANILFYLSIFGTQLFSWFLSRLYSPFQLLI